MSGDLDTKLVAKFFIPRPTGVATRFLGVATLIRVHK